VILLTTSRRPTKAIRTFCKDLSHIIPRTIRINRGKLSLKEVAEKALESNAEKIIMVDRWKAGPGKIQFFKIERVNLKPTPPLIYLMGVKLRREFAEAPLKGRRIKSIFIAASSASPEVEKLERALSKFLEVPLISIDSPYKEGFDALIEVGKELSGYITVKVRLIPDLFEVGPRMNISHIIWKL
jgi:U3 small nucleolar ribonucleoprotein protein IMP4